jgi:hypothetical protein
MTDDELLDAKWGIDFGVAKSIRYHAYRRSFWEALDNWTKALVLISGTAVLVSVIGQNGPVAKVFAFLVATVSAADIILGFSARVRLHDSLYRAFCRLGHDISENLHPTVEDVAKWRSRRLEIEMDEPGTLDWLERRCSAEEARARGLEVNERWILPGWKIWLSQLAIWPHITRP